jgi:hypothetical protein
MRNRTLIIALVISTAAAGLVSAQETPQAVAVGPWRTGVAVNCPDVRTIPANTVISGPDVTAEDLCGSNSSSGSGSSSTPNVMISNTGNTGQDLVTNGVNLFIASHTTNQFASSFMQGAATSFISSMFANNAEAQRQQQLMAQEILRRQQEQERQRRIAAQRRFDAMYARLTTALKLDGLPFSLSLKGMNSPTPDSLALKGMSSQGPDDLKLKLADSSSTGYGIKGLPGIYVGGPSSGDAPTNQAAAANTSATPAANPNLASGAGTGATGPGIPGLPGIYLDTVQPAQAPQLAQATEKLDGPERVLAQESALQAAGKNPDLAAPSQDPAVQNFQQANQDYKQTLAANAAASQALQNSQNHVEADKSALDVARAQLNSVTPSVQQQQAFNQMITAAKTDEEAAELARQNFDSTNIHLSAARDHAATALAALTPSSVPVASNDTSVVDLSHATHMQPNLLRSPSAAPVARAVRVTPPTVAAAGPRTLALAVAADQLKACLAAAAHAGVIAANAPSQDQLQTQLEQSKEALRRLIENHEKEDALREQWEEETNDTIHDAKKQAFDLSVDYVFHNAQAVTRAKIWRADAETEELQKLLAAGGDPSKLASVRAQIEQATSHRHNLQQVLDGLKEVKTRIEEQQRMRDLREFGSKDPKELQEASNYLEGAKQLIQAALAEDSVKNALQFTPYANDAIKWGSSLIDTSYDLTAEFLSFRQLDQLNRNSNQYLQAVKALDGRIHTTVDQLGCYKAESTTKVASRGE